MKNLIIAGNWKSNKTKNEAKEWIEDFGQQKFPENIEIILFTPYTLLDMFSAYIKVNDLPIHLGAQNVSRFPKGAYTGEIYANQIKELAEYVLIGHSERRSNFYESDKIINEKIKSAKKADLKMIVCISKMEQLKSLPKENELIIAFEPIEAIGTGKAEDPEAVSSFVSKVKESGSRRVLYGGSVDPNNIKDYMSIEEIEGALVGSESLDAQSFISVIKNAS